MIVTDIDVLRTKCEPVLASEVDDLRLRLEAELAASAERGEPGIGLAAPQIGIPKRMAIVRVPVGNKLLSVDLVNCRIHNKYDRAIFNNEGCLSFPGRQAKTYRYREIHVVDNLVAPHSFIATGLFGVCIQHELDHLDGVLLPDVEIPGTTMQLKKLTALDLDNLNASQEFLYRKKLQW